jgi:AhpD family alkylhydroperoxidase
MAIVIHMGQAALIKARATEPWQVHPERVRMTTYTIDTGERIGSMDEFDRYRAEMNEKLLGSNHLGIKRFFALDTQAYEEGALDKRTKELLGLVASTVLRCDDCITYHIKQCVDAGITRPQFLDAFNVALVVGGSITIPHLRRAIDRLDQTLDGQGNQAAPVHRHD